MLVSNSSTIILTAKISLLSIFLNTAKKIAITNVVYREILKKDSFENLVIKKEVENGRIKIESIEPKFYSNIIKQFRLDEGEASTFALCINKKYNGILTDDKELIKLCKIEGTQFITAMTVVIRLFNKKVINKNEALEKLERLQSYGRYSNDIHNYFRNMVR